MSPWIEATRNLRANRWLDESGVALRALAIRGSTSVMASLKMAQISLVAASSGHSSVSGALTVEKRVQGASAGATLVSGAMGYLYDLEGQSAGSTQVAGETFVGQVEPVAGLAVGKTTVSADLNVRPYSFIKGKQGDDNWGPNETLPPMGSGRDEGSTRRRFTKHSVGRATGALA